MYLIRFERGETVPVIVGVKGLFFVDFSVNPVIMFTFKKEFPRILR